MIKNLTRIEHNIGEKAFHLLFDNDTSIVQIIESLYHFLGTVTAIQKNLADQQAALKAVQPPPEKTDATE